MTDLGTLGGTTSLGFAVNDASQVTGYSTLTIAGKVQSHAFVTGPNGSGMTDLGTLGSGTFSAGYAINASGQVTGYSYLSGATGYYHAFLTMNGGMKDLGTLAGGTSSIGQSVNAPGQVAGVSYFANGTYRAFLTEASGGTMHDLGTLTTGGSSYAYGVNNKGQVVGYATTASGVTDAFLYQDGKMVDLNSLADAIPGVHLTEALAINNNGSILAEGIDAMGQTQAYLLLTATPEPASLAMMGVGLGFGWRRRRSGGVASPRLCRALGRVSKPLLGFSSWAVYNGGRPFARSRSAGGPSSLVRGSGAPPRSRGRSGPDPFDDGALPMALGTQARGKLLDYEQYIDHQLQRTQARIKMNDVASAALILVTAVLSVLFLEIVLDHAVALPAWVRRIVLFGGLLGATTYAAMKIVRPLVANISGLYAAKTIETAEPGFKNGLINYLSLKKDRENLPKSFLAAIEAKAVSQLTEVDVERVVNQKRVTQICYALAAIVVIFCIYALITPKPILDSARRAFLADVAAPTDTRLAKIAPGDAQVTAGQHVPFRVEVDGTRPEKVVLHYSVDGGDFFAEQEFAKGEHYYDPWQTTLRNVQRSMDYYLTGGDARSKTYHVEVLPAPMVTGVTVDLDFPEYTGVPDRVGVEGGEVRAIEGTKVTVHAKTNEPASSGKLRLGKLGTFAMQKEGDDDKALVGKFLVTENGQYHVQFTTTDGQNNPEPVLYEIRAEKDKPPTVKIVKPTPSFKVPSNGMVEVVIEATDDFGVKSLELSAYQGAERIKWDRLPELKDPKRTLHQSFSLDLARLKVKPGTKLQYWATVRDTKQPQPNKTETSHYEIEVIDPAKPPEVAKLKDEAKKDKDDTKRADAVENGPDQEKMANNGATQNGEPQGGQDGTGQGKPGEGTGGTGKEPTALAGIDKPNEPEQGAKSNSGKDLTEQDIKNLQNLARNQNRAAARRGRAGALRPNGNNPPPQGGSKPAERRPECHQPGPGESGGRGQRSGLAHESEWAAPERESTPGRSQWPERRPPGSAAAAGGDVPGRRHAPGRRYAPRRPGPASAADQPAASQKLENTRQPAANPTQNAGNPSTSQGGTQGTSGASNPNNPGGPQPNTPPMKPEPGAGESRRVRPPGRTTRPSSTAPAGQARESRGRTLPTRRAAPGGAPGSGHPGPSGKPNEPKQARERPPARTAGRPADAGREQARAGEKPTPRREGQGHREQGRARQAGRPGGGREGRRPGPGRQAGRADQAPRTAINPGPDGNPPGEKGNARPAERR